MYNNEENFILHTRKIKTPDLVKDLYKRNINPSFEYDKDPILNREVEMGKQVVYQRNPDLKGMELGVNIEATLGNDVEIQIVI